MTAIPAIETQKMFLYESTVRETHHNITDLLHQRHYAKG